MNPLTDKEQEYYDEQNVIYVKDGLFIIKIKIHIKITKKLEIIVILQENLEGLLIAFVI